MESALLLPCIFLLDNLLKKLKLNLKRDIDQTKVEVVAIRRMCEFSIYIVTKTDTFLHPLFSYYYFNSNKSCTLI